MCRRGSRKEETHLTVTFLAEIIELWQQQLAICSGGSTVRTKVASDVRLVLLVIFYNIITR